MTDSPTAAPADDAAPGDDGHGSGTRSSSGSGSAAAGGTPTGSGPSGSGPSGSGTSRGGVPDHQRRVGSRDVTEWRSRAGRRLAQRHDKVARTVGPRATLVASLVAGGAVATLMTFLAALTYDAVTDRDGIASLDKPTLAAAKRLRSPAVDTGAAGIAYLFGPVGMPIMALSAAAALSARQKQVSPLTLLTAAGAGSLLMTVRGKGIVHRNRPRRRDAVPPYESSPSFPSGHTLNATTIAGTLAYLLALQQKRQAPQVAIIASAAGVVTAVGLSRVLLGAHWLTDVAFGWLSGTGWLAVVITSHRLYLTSRTQGE